MTQLARRRLPVPRFLRRLLKDERGQGMVEVVILAAIVGLGLAWVTMELPNAIGRHYQQNIRVLASPM